MVSVNNTYLSQNCRGGVVFQEVQGASIDDRVSRHPLAGRPRKASPCQHVHVPCKLCSLDPGRDVHHRCGRRIHDLHHLQQLPQACRAEVHHDGRHLHAQSSGPQV